MHGGHGVLDVLWAQHFQPTAEHVGSEFFFDPMRDYERRVFEATVASNVKGTTATTRLHATLAERGRGHETGHDGGRGRGGHKGECE